MLSYILTSKSDALVSFRESGSFEEIPLKGSTPVMAYCENIVNGMVQAIERRFELDSKNVFNATKILNFKTWPLSGTELQGF